MTSYQKVIEHIADQVAATSEGGISREEALQPGRTLVELGLSSLAYLCLIDALESEFGVFIDLSAGVDGLDTTDGLARYLLAQGVDVGS